MENNQYYQPTNTPPQEPNQYQPPQQPYQPPYQQPYQAPYQPMPVYDETSEVMSVGSYIGLFVLSSIPIVNIICWIVWLVSPNTNKNKRNYCIAYIIIYAVAIVLSVIFTLVSTAMGVSLLDSFMS